MRYMTSVQSSGESGLAETLALLQGLQSHERLTPAATGALAPDVRAWIADPGQSAAASIDSVQGADATRAALAGLESSELVVTASVFTDRACWAEFTRRGVGDPETGLVGLTLDGEGRVRRLVLLRAALVPPSALGESSSAPPGRPILQGYFNDLMSSRFREASAHFSADALYSHPPYAGGSERVLFAGREALHRGLQFDRGPSPARQVITGFWQSGARVFLEGVVDGIPDGGSFFSTAEISPRGEIARYVAFYSATRIPT
jgi:hypothetical protein